MPSIVLTGKTGQGSNLLSSGAAVTVLGAQFDITSLGAGKYRELDSAAPKRIQYAGSLALGAPISSVDTLVTPLHILWEHQGWVLSVPIIKTVYWFLAGGVTATITILW